MVDSDDRTGPTRLMYETLSRLAASDTTRIRGQTVAPVMENGVCVRLPAFQTDGGEMVSGGVFYITEDGCTRVVLECGQSRIFTPTDDDRSTMSASERAWHWFCDACIEWVVW